MLSIMRWLLRGLAGAGVALVVGLGAVYSFQEKLLYVPRIPGVSNEFAYLPPQFGLDYEDVWTTAKDGTKLHSWMMWPRGWTKDQRRSRPTVLFFQENAGNMSFRLPFLRLVTRHLQCSVFAPSYRGYGLSKGSPSESGLRQDAQAALNYVRANAAVDGNNIIVFGRSLGGAVAFGLLAANPGSVKSLIVENTFWSIEAVTGKVLPFLAPFVGPGRLFNFLIRNHWHSGEAIAQLGQLPVLLLSSVEDEMLPVEHMDRLYTTLKAKGGQVSIVKLHAGHMDAYETASQDYWPAVLEFVEQHGSSTLMSTDQDGGEGVQRAVQASQAGVKPPSTVGPLNAGSQQDEAQQGATVLGGKKTS